jgi:hypothetical protein
MYERRIEQAARYGDVALESVLRIEHGDVELLDRQIFQALREDFVDIAWPSDGCAFLPLFRRHAPSQLERGVDTNSTSRTDPAHAGKGRDRLAREQSQRTAAR